MTLVISPQLTRALRRAAVSGTRAPSVHNTQPWKFVLRPGVLEFYADRSRQLGVLDPSGRQLHLSAGSALFNARVSLAASSVACMVQRFPDPATPELVARIEIDASEAPDHALAALNPVLELRRSNRRRFATDPVPDELVATLIDAATSEAATLHPVVEPEDRQTLTRLSQQADIEQITNAAYRAELRAWTTNDPTRLDGVRAATVPHVDGSAGDELAIRDFDSQGAGWLPSETRSSASQSLLVLGTDADTRQAWLQAGEALERVWLEITRAGFVASLFTQVIEVAALRAQLRRDLRLGMHPHLVLRVGRAQATAPSMRRHLSEVLDDRTHGGEQDSGDKVTELAPSSPERQPSHPLSAARQLREPSSGRGCRLERSTKPSSSGQGGGGGARGGDLCSVTGADRGQLRGSRDAAAAGTVLTHR